MKPARHAASLFAILALLAGAAPIARAQNASDQAAARSLFDEGARLYAAGNYPEACAKLEASYHLYAGLGTRGKLAECYEKVGRTASAWAMYREVAALATKAGDAAREKVATDRATALEPKLAHLDIVLPPANDAPGLVIKRGAEAVERGELGTPVPIDPGTIAFEVSAPGKVTKTAEVKVDPGASVTFTVPALDPVAGATAPTPATGAPATAGPAPTPASTSAPPPGASSDDAAAQGGPSGATWQKPTGLVVGGAGVVAAAVGGILALTAKSSYDSAFSGGHCDHATLTCDATGQSQTDGARTQATVGGVVFGVGLAMVAGGGLLYFTAPKGEAPPASGLRVTPEVGPTTAGLTLAGGF